MMMLRRLCFWKKIKVLLPENYWPTNKYVTHPHMEPTNNAIEEFKDDMRKLNPDIAFEEAK